MRKNRLYLCFYLICLVLQNFAAAGDFLSSHPQSAQGGMNTAPGAGKWYSLSYRLKFSGKVPYFSLTSLLPQTILGRQRVYELWVAPDADKVYRKNNNKYIRWQLKNSASGLREFVVYFRAELLGHEALSSVSSAANSSKAEDKGGRRELSREKSIECDCEAIKEAVKSIDSSGADFATARNILEYIKGRMKYKGLLKKDLGAEQALAGGVGDCTDYTDIFVAMCRRLRIPARHISGYMSIGSGFIGHSWAEFYSSELGRWVVLDPLNCALGLSEFGKIDPEKYIKLSNIRNDKELRGGLLYRWSVSRGVKFGLKVQLRQLDHSPLEDNDKRLSRIK